MSTSPTIQMLAAGMGLRLAATSNGRPKALVALAGRNLLERGVATYAHQSLLLRCGATLDPDTYGDVFTTMDGTAVVARD